MENNRASNNITPDDSDWLNCLNCDDMDCFFNVIQAEVAHPL